MQKDEQEMTRIAAAVERYLSDHKSAADSLENVMKWWLSHQRYQEALEDVQKALDYLVNNGRIVKTKNTDGTFIFSKPK